MLATRLPAMRFDDPALTAVPAAVLAAGADLVASFAGREGEGWDD